jgi:hypothetical protein
MKAQQQDGVGVDHHDVVRNLAVMPITAGIGC